MSISVLPMTLHAAAGPPMVTDDPGTPGPGIWEVNIGAAVERRLGEERADLPALDLNYGLGERIQLNYGGGWLISRVPGGARATAIDDSELAVKWRFVDRGPVLQVSMYPRVAFRTPGSHALEHGLTQPGTSWLLPIQVQTTIRGLDINLEAGRLHEPDSRGWIYGAAISGSLADGREVAAELAGSHSPQGDALLANLGARIPLARHWRLIVSLGRELRNRAQAPVLLHAYAALQYTTD